MEVGTRSARLSVGMDFAVRTNGNGHFDNVLKDLIGLIGIDEIVGYS